MTIQSPNRAGSFTINRRDNPDLQLSIDWTFVNSGSEWIQDGRKIRIDQRQDQGDGGLTKYTWSVDGTPAGLVWRVSSVHFLWQAEVVGGAHSGVVGASHKEAVASLLTGILPAKL